MYISKPNVFVVPHWYVERQVLGIEMFSNREELLIGVSFPSTTIPRLLRDKEAMEKEAAEKGVQIKVEIADNTPELQAKQIQNLISHGVKVLIITPTDSVAMAQVVEMAKKAGIKVIAYIRLVLNSDLDLYVGSNNMQVGEIQGRFLIKNVPKGNYIIMSGDPNSSSARIFKEGAMEFILPLVYLGNIKIIAEEAVINWEPENAYKIVKNALMANKNKVNAILAPNDATAGASIKALEEQGLAGKVVVTGQDADLDAIKRILKGTQSMTVFKDSIELGKTAIDFAIKLVKGETINTDSAINNGMKKVPAILTSPILITKENIDDIIIKSGYLKKEEVYNTGL